MSRNEEQPYGAAVVGAIGGLIAGYVLWLAAITIGDDFTTVGTWSLPILLGSGALAVGAVLVGLVMRWRRKRGWVAFAFALPIAPLLLSLAVLADIYL